MRAITPAPARRPGRRSATPRHSASAIGPEARHERHYHARQPKAACQSPDQQAERRVQSACRCPQASIALRRSGATGGGSARRGQHPPSGSRSPRPRVAQSRAARRSPGTSVAGWRRQQRQPDQHAAAQPSASASTPKAMPQPCRRPAPASRKPASTSDMPSASRSVAMVGGSLPTCRAAQTPAANQPGPRGRVRFGAASGAQCAPITLARRGNRGSRFRQHGRDAQLPRSAQLRHVTQPAFSRRIQALEAWAGIDLVDRSSTRRGSRRPARPSTPRRSRSSVRCRPRNMMRTARAARGHDRLRRAALAGLHLFLHCDGSCAAASARSRAG